MQRVCLAVFSLVVLSGCVVIPQPHDVVRLSKVTGSVSRQGQPVENLTLTMNALDNRSTCEDPIAVTTTDADGRFVFEEITQRRFWRVVILAPSSPTYYLGLCTGGPEGRVPLIERRIWATLPRQLALECDLQRHREEQESCSVAGWTGYNFIIDDAGYNSYRPEAARGMSGESPKR
jgi:hypothetical protein